MLKAIEFIVDGNGCVKASVLAAVRELSGFCRFVCRSCQPEEISKHLVVARIANQDLVLRGS